MDEHSLFRLLGQFNMKYMLDAGPDLDGGAWDPGVVGGPMCGYKMFR